MKKISLLDEALKACLEAFNDPKALTDWPAANQAAQARQSAP